MEKRQQSENEGEESRCVVLVGWGLSVSPRSDGMLGHVFVRPTRELCLLFFSLFLFWLALLPERAQMLAQIVRKSK